MIKISMDKKIEKKNSKNKVDIECIIFFIILIIYILCHQFHD